MTVGACGSSGASAQGDAGPPTAADAALPQPDAPLPVADAAAPSVDAQAQPSPDAAPPPPDAAPSSLEAMTAPFVTVASEWEWLNPLPSGGDLRAIKLMAGDDVWIVGDAGLLIHWDGQAWRQLETHVMPALEAVDGTADGSALFAVGAGGAMVRRMADGTMTPVPTGTTHALTSVLVRSANDVWIGVDVGLVREPVDHWVGAVLHWDGQTVTWVHDTPFPVRAIVGGAAGDLWALGAGAERWDGATWTPETLPGSYPAIKSASWVGDGDIWAAGGVPYHRYHGVWVQVALPSGAQPTYDSVWAAPNGSVLLSNTTGELLRNDGAGFHYVWEADTKRGAWIYGMAGTGADDLWRVGSHGFVQRVVDGNAYLVSRDITDDLDAANLNLSSIVALDADDLRVSGTVWWDFTDDHGEPIMLRLDGTRLVESDPAAPGTLLWGFSDDDLVAHGWGDFNYAFFTQGQWWGYSCNGGTVYDGSIAMGVSADDLWMTGPGGKMCHRGASAWEEVDLPTTIPITDLWMVSHTDGYAVGVGGTMLRYLDGSWVGLPTSTQLDLVHVWGAGPDDVWIAGYDSDAKTGHLFRWDGMKLEEQPLPVPMAIHSIWGTSSTDIWLAGDGVLVHYDGRDFTASAVAASVRFGRNPGSVGTAVDLPARVLRRRAR